MSNNLPQAKLPVLNADGTFQLPWYRFLQEVNASGVGSGSVNGPAASVVGDFAIWNSSDGIAITDGGKPGFLAFLNSISHIYVNDWTTAVDTTVQSYLIAGANITLTPAIGSLTIAVSGLGALAFQSTITASQISDPVNVKPLESLEIVCSNETTPLTTGTAVVTFWIPYNFTATQVFIGNSTASSSGAVTANLKQNGTTVFSTNPSIGASQNTSLSGSGSVAAVLSVTSYTQGDKMTVDITAAGTGATGLKLILIGHRT